MNMERKCVIVGNTVVTGICTHVSNAAKMCMDADGKDVTLTPVPDAHLTISGTLSVCVTFFFFANSTFKKNCLDYKRYHGKLVENDVAKCSGQSCSNVGIGSVSHPFLLSEGHCQRKLKLNCVVFETDILIRAKFYATLER
ncbi:hypothetical protein KIN20_019429 [Parelaphostrongylus tenuis]|uniref:Uncharacterized protein n=1 Tax=Parelaphostrongylus tenuis TaxID=148309 RepID=A0AAD5N347_PARTN|nr:hypothetical protein KIN20_019429 [Parelaphostrongylus tenuis]